jgi:abhydrolase domain-containing protein 14
LEKLGNESIMEENNPRFLTVGGIKFRIKTSRGLGTDPSKPVVVLFHGFSFNLDAWDRIGTYKELARRSIPYLGVDLPKGKETKTQRKAFPQLSDYTPLLTDLFKEAGVNPNSKLIIVGPSMGGAFALAYAEKRKEEVLGLILVAPSLSGVNQDLLEGLDIPVLLIWGDKDTIFPVEQKGREIKEMLPHSKLLIVKGARHPVYLDRPNEFHELLFDFIEELTA